MCCDCILCVCTGSEPAAASPLHQVLCWTTGQTGEECGVMTRVHNLMWGWSLNMQYAVHVCYVTQLNDILSLEYR